VRLCNLQEHLGEASDSGESKERSVDDNARSSVLLGAAAAGTRASIRVGIGVVAGAGECALDLATAAIPARSLLLELSARRLNVSRARNIEGALDIIKSRKSSPIN